MQSRWGRKKYSMKFKYISCNSYDLFREEMRNGIYTWQGDYDGNKILKAYLTIIGNRNCIEFLSIYLKNDLIMKFDGKRIVDYA